MASASFRFYAELNDFLPPHKKQIKLAHSFPERASIKDIIESFGVPHPEVDCIAAKFTGKGRIMKDCNSLLTW